MKGLRSDLHQVSSYEYNKISLSCYDDKRYILDDGITSLAYGNCKKIDKQFISIWEEEKDITIKTVKDQDKKKEN